MVLHRWHHKGQQLKTSQKLFLIKFWQHITWLYQNIKHNFKVVVFLVLNFLVKSLQKKKDLFPLMFLSLHE